MFDIGFTEIMAILLVALVVIGPERLPQVARTLGGYWGRMQRYVNKVKQDVNNSIELDELREMERQARDEAEDLQRSIQQAASDIELDLRQTGNQVDRSMEEARSALSESRQ